LKGLMLEDFLKEISPDTPCGKNLEDDVAFAQLENEAKYTAERQMGNTIIPEVQPDWKKVRDLSLSLLDKSRDIQVATHLTCALLHTDGFVGLAQGLSLIRGLLEKYWDDVYPQRDLGDDYPILRINTLSNLTDFKKILDPIGHIKLFHSKAGAFSWRDIEIAQGKTTSAGNTDSPDIALIDAAVLDTGTDMETLGQNKMMIAQALESCKGIVSCVAEKSGSSYAPDLSPLINLLSSIDKFLSEKIQLRSASETVTGDFVTETEGIGGIGLDKRSAMLGKGNGIHSRDDVVWALDAICRYFERYEPSSPIPFLMHRAKKLLMMNFMDILRELAPDALKQAENICGAQQKENK
jgi:type VI secretion system protein ImpA